MNKQQKIKRIQDLVNKNNLPVLHKEDEMDFYSEPSLDELLKYLERYEGSSKSNEDHYTLTNKINLWQEKYSFY